MSNGYKQAKDYTCGPAAVSYFLARHGIHYDQTYLEGVLLSTPQSGTSHDAIQSFLYAIEFPFTSGDMRFSVFRLPMLVNYWKDDDGHYGVITELRIDRDGTSSIVLFDPEDGELKHMTLEAFRATWFSKRYGKNWGLCTQ